MTTPTAEYATPVTGARVGTGNSTWASAEVAVEAYAYSQGSRAARAELIEQSFGDRDAQLADRAG